MPQKFQSKYFLHTCPTNFPYNIIIQQIVQPHSQTVVNFFEKGQIIIVSIRERFIRNIWFIDEKKRIWFRNRKGNSILVYSVKDNKKYRIESKKLTTEFIKKSSYYTTFVKGDSVYCWDHFYSESKLISFETEDFIFHDIRNQSLEVNIKQLTPDNEGIFDFE